MEEDHEHTKSDYVPNLCSKESIVLIGLLISPILATYLYCANLRITNQKEKIAGFFISILVFDLMLFFPFLGFNTFTNSINPYPFIHKIIVTLLMVFPFWKNHFGRIEYKTFFPAKRFLLLITLYVSILTYNHLINKEINSYVPLPWFVFHINPFSIAILALPFIFTRVIYQFIKAIVRSRKKKLNE